VTEFCAFVLDQLRDVGDVTCRAMFGGYGLRAGGIFFAIIYDDQLFLKVSPATRPAFEAEGMGPFRPTPKQTLKTYYETPADVLENRDELTRWAKRAIDAAADGGRQ